MLSTPRPTTAKLLNGIRLQSKALTNLSSLFPLDGSSTWKPKSLSLCLGWVLASIQSVTHNNLNLYAQLALQYGYHHSLVNLTNYAEDLQLVSLAMRQIGILCVSKKYQVVEFLSQGILSTIKARLLNRTFVVESNLSANID